AGGTVPRMSKHRAVMILLSGAALAGGAPPAAVQEVQAQPHLMFVSVLPGAFGKVGLVPLVRPDAPPAFTDLTCHRVHFAAGRGICMVYDFSGGSPPFFAFTFDRTLQAPSRKITLAGRPSRTRVSPGGRYGAMTVFLTGDSYACDFSTRSTLVDMRDGSILGD